MTEPLVPLQRHPALTVREVPGKGRGLFIAADVPAGALLEEAPVIPMRPEDAVPRQSILYNYPFGWEDPPYVEAVALGAISMANHDDNPNARFQTDLPAKLVRLFAKRDLRAGEEVTIDYVIELWFDAAPKTEEA